MDEWIDMAQMDDGNEVPVSDLKAWLWSCACFVAASWPVSWTTTGVLSPFQVAMGGGILRA